MEKVMMTPEEVRISIALLEELRTEASVQCRTGGEKLQSLGERIRDIQERCPHENTEETNFIVGEMKTVITVCADCGAEV